MTIEVYAKIGTMSQRKIRIGWKQKLPQVGDMIKFRSVPEVPGEKWRSGYITEIHHVGYLLFFISL